jgi:nucleoside-diphosphate-sugar epimerase
MKTALVLGAGGFIGGHMVKRLKSEGYWVRGVDKKLHEHEYSHADDFQLADLTLQSDVRRVIDDIHFDEVYQLAADMGGAGYINTNLYDADVMHNSATINLNVLHRCKQMSIKKVFFSSSACVYNEELQSSNVNPDCRESSAYPAHPDSEYGWEKLFSERLFHAYNRQHGMQNKVARFHNIFGPYGTWDGGKEKFPAAICRKIAKANDGDEIEIWGDGEQTRSFLYIDDCIEGVRHLMNSETFHGPVNIGADQMISINDTVDLVAQIAGKTIRKKHIDGPTGVRGRNSNNELIEEKLNWRPSQNLKEGLKETYRWINFHVRGK